MGLAGAGRLVPPGGPSCSLTRCLKLEAEERGESHKSVISPARLILRDRGTRLGFDSIGPSITRVFLWPASSITPKVARQRVTHNNNKKSKEIKDMEETQNEEKKKKKRITVRIIAAHKRRLS